MRYLMLIAGCLLIASLMFAGCENTTRTAENQNIETVRHVHAELVKGNAGIMDEVLAPGYLRHCQAMPPELQELTDIEVFKTFLVDFVAAVPGYTDSIGPIMASGDMVAYVSTMKGTQTGPMGDLPASGKEFTIVNLVIHRFENGKIAESWVTWDNLAMLSQLGFFPPPMPEQP